MKPLKIEETEIWKELCKLSLTARESMIEQFASKIEAMFNCKIVNRSFTDLGTITNPALSVQDGIRDICYVKEFVPVNPK